MTIETNRQTPATLRVSCDIDVRVDDDSGVREGPAVADLIFNLPGSIDALLHFLRSSDWVMEFEDKDWNIDTIDCDDVGEWEETDSGLSLVEPAESDSDDEEDHEDEDEDEENDGSPGGYSEQVLRCMMGVGIAEAFVQIDGQETEIDSTVDGILAWLEQAYGPLQPAGVFAEWESPLSCRTDLEVVAAEPDPAIVTNAAWRLQIRATGLPWRLRHGPSGIEFVLVPPARGYFGPVNGEWQPGAGPRGRMGEILNPFYLAVVPFTMAQWYRTFGRELPAHAAAQRDSVVCNLDAADIRGILGALKMQLPTQDEWEFACRAGSTGDRYGDAWSKEKIARSQPKGGWGGTGLLRPNEFGLHDMIGLVWEPCIGPKGIGAPLILRGGSGRDPEERCTATSCREMPPPTGAGVPSSAMVPVGLRPIIRVSEADDGLPF